MGLKELPQVQKAMGSKQPESAPFAVIKGLKRLGIGSAGKRLIAPQHPAYSFRIRF